VAAGAKEKPMIFLKVFWKNGAISKDGVSQENVLKLNRNFISGFIFSSSQAHFSRQWS
jgi:hypothetical protein